MTEAATTPLSCPAYVLAGGKSRRFGSDKLQHRIEGKPQLERLVESLGREGFSVKLVARKLPQHSPCPVVADIQGHGPIAGLHAAAEDRRQSAGEGWFLVVPGDQFVWQQVWFQQLWAAAIANHGATQVRGAACCAAVFKDPAGRLQPLPGLYHTNMLPSLNQSIEAGDLRLVGLLEELALRNTQAKGSSPNVVVVATNSSPQATSFNTPDELRRLME